MARLDGLGGIDWRLAALVGPDGDLVPPPDGIGVGARFADGRVAGSAGCNRYSGALVEDGDGVLIVGVMTTLMACPDDVMAVESAFLRLLATVEDLAVAGDGLDLLGPGRRVLLRFVGSPVTLAGTRWLATGINNGHGGVASPAPGTGIEAAFGDDGRISGTGGCNRFSGSWTAEGESLTLGPLATTRRRCPGPGGVMEQEAAFLAAMGRVATYGVDGETLELRSADGALQVSFRVA